MGEGGPSPSLLCPQRPILCPFLICTPLTSPAPSAPIVPFCAARCRLGEDRLPKRARRRVRSQGAGVRATQGSTGAFIDSMGTRGQRGAGAGPTSLAPCRSVHTPTAGPRAWPLPQSTHGEPCEDWDFPRSLLPPGQSGSSHGPSGPRKPWGQRLWSWGWASGLLTTPLPEVLHAHLPHLPAGGCGGYRKVRSRRLSGWHRGNSGIRCCTTSEEGRVLLASTQREQLHASVGNKGRLCSV